jgi:putative holliday junction resolvase
MSRVVGVDLGSKRIGIAVSDAGASLASPLTVLERSGSIEHDHVKINALAVEEEAACVVVGVPVNLAGEISIAAQSILEEVEQMKASIDVPIELWDERMTTAAAHKNLAAQNVSAKKRRGQIDKFAAAVMLQGWLDSRQLQGGR